MDDRRGPSPFVLGQDRPCGAAPRLSSAMAGIGSWAPDERGAPRLSSDIAVLVDRELHPPHEATLLDISRDGCRLASDRRMVSGTFVAVTIPSFSSFKGWVAWSQGDQYGISFAHHLPAEVVEHIATMAG